MMRRFISLFSAILLVFSGASPVSAYKILYAEQWYDLYHQNFYSYPQDYLENIWYLERAMSADFANPLNAMSHQIEVPRQHERYRYLFSMQVNVELTKQYRALAAGYGKPNAYYFNAPWREMTLNSLRFAESYYEAALYYWSEALEWSHKAWRLRVIDLTDIAHWQDINYRIETGDLDFRDLIEGDLAHLRDIRSQFEEMDKYTFSEARP